MEELVLCISQEIQDVVRVKLHGKSDSSFFLNGRVTLKI